MAVHFNEGETKKRPGMYMRYTNIGGKPAEATSVNIGGFVPPVIPEGAIDSAAYENLAAALTAAENGDTVVVSIDTTVAESIRVPEGKAITLRIPAGVTLGLEAGSGNYGMVVKGELVIEGDGDIVVSGYGFGTSMKSDSKITIKSGHFIAKGCDYLIGVFDGDVVIEGGVFDGEYCVVNNFSEYYKTDGTLTITGGTFRTSDPEGFDVLGAPVAISGGWFSKPVNADHCAEGKTPIEQDGYYTVE